MAGILRLNLSSFLWLMFSIPLVKAGGPPAPVIREITVADPTVEQFGKFEAIIDLTATYANPFDYDQIRVAATFVSPSGAETEVDGFFMQDYDLNTGNGALTPTGTGDFRVRFSPDVTGTWSFTLEVTDASGTARSEATTFRCVDRTTSANHGFLRAGQTNYLSFDDGSPYIAIGENIAWQNINAFLDYKKWLDGLIENDGNYFRLWHAHWGLGIEWRAGNGFQGLRHYKQTNCFYQDWLFDYCAENGVYVMLALQHHGPVSTQVNPNWNESPYNVVNGGPCQNTLEFFTNAEARAHTKNRYRYIVARWGYSRSILCWELFNEVHWTDNFQANKPLVADWHFEMSEFLKTIDPNQHIVTTSYGNDLTDEQVWSHPDFEVTQSHTYINTANLERALAADNRRYLERFEKPTLNGEFGLGPYPELSNEDPDGIHLHNCLWGGLFSGAFGTAMSWWWDSYVHPRDLYYHFSGLSRVATMAPFLEKNLKPADAYVAGAPGDLSLIPTLDWAGIGEPEITIDESGGISPENAMLGKFLYGSQWNTQYRSPPEFNVIYPDKGTFTVTTSGETGAAPKIAIWVDGELLLERNATPNTAYSVEVASGSHLIRVDNTGTDWITIASYSFEGLGSQVDAYVLVAEDRDMAAGWALNNLYNHRNIIDNGEPAPTPPSEVVVRNFQDGAYTVQWIDPLTGVSYGSDEAQAAGGALTIPLPSLLWDVAFIVEGRTTSTRAVRQSLAFDIFPNPLRAGQSASVNLSGEDLLIDELSLLDASGREISRRLNQDRQFQVPADIAAGFYWVKILNNGKVGVRPLVVVQD